MPASDLPSREYPSLLLRDRLNPITNCFAFLLHASAQRLDSEGAKARRALMELEAAKDRSVYVPRRIEGGLEAILRGLLPLAIHAYRYAVIPTASTWTAFFDNGRRGSDLSSAMFALSRREKCRNLLLTIDPDEIDGKRRPTLWLGGSLRFQLSGPHAGVVDDPTDRRLLQAMVADAGRWIWDALGEPLPFEQPERYQARRKKDRLPALLIAEYAAALGVRPFDEDFYAPEGWGTIVTREGWRPPKNRDFTLDEVQERIWTPPEERRHPWGTG